jgi:[acyl-carrier-protein] S-malonyltransferase
MDASNERSKRVTTKSNPGRIAFMFPGQGSFEPGMGRDIAAAVPEAMQVFDEGSEAAGLDLRRLCFTGTQAELTKTELQQPALVATSLAIEAALRARGIAPEYVVGHSVGEFSALGAAGSLSVREAIAVVRERGLAMAEAAARRPGSMAAILGLADEIVEMLCQKIANVWPANYNCPGQLVVSGQTDAVEECCSEAQHQGARRTVRLRVSGAFHSPLVEHAAERLRPAIDRIEFKVPKAQFVSTVTAKIEEAGRYRSLLVEQLTAPVRFTQAAGEMIGQGVTTFVEVGPGNVLSGLLKRIDSSVKAISVNDLKSLDAAADELG